MTIKSQLQSKIEELENELKSFKEQRTRKELA